MSEIYLGEPPADIKAWIEQHTTPLGPTTISLMTLIQSGGYDCIAKFTAADGTTYTMNAYGSEKHWGDIESWIYLYADGMEGQILLQQGYDDDLHTIPNYALIMGQGCAGSFDNVVGSDHDTIALNTDFTDEYGSTLRFELV